MFSFIWFGVLILGCFVDLCAFGLLVSCVLFMCLWYDCCLCLRVYGFYIVVSIGVALGWLRLLDLLL